MRRDTIDAAVGERLRTGLQVLGYGDRLQLAEKLLAYLRLLVRWNRAYNLTAVRDPGQMVTRHLLDSLAIAPCLPATAGRLVDVGSGAGLPGAPLALLQPQRCFDLLDSNGKKTRFLFQVKTELGLDNMSVHRIRAQFWTPPRPYDVVLSRAFASLGDMLDCCRHLCSPSGCFLAMKGAHPDEELAALRGRCKIRRIYPVRVPGLREERHVVCLEPLAQGVQPAERTV